ncbi:MAG TPA: S41 family peptidase, partial [Phycisphaerae bacterium]|nr:S41 family peptidase [Phycisphaerae bacterium]
EGDFLIAIDGEEVRSTDNVYRFLENKSGKVVRLTYNSRASKDGAKTCRVKTIGSESSIRYHEWVDHNREMVAKASGGKIGYLHIPDMQEAGLIEFARAFYPQHAKEAMIIDERYNTGGFVGDMIIDRLERKMWAMTQAREGKVIRNPENAFYGHFAVLINEDTGSNGEFFAYAIKTKGLAPLIGERTWGGAIGIEAHEPLVDSGTITPPQFGLYDLKGNWAIEGHGVDPDIEVQNMPGDVLKGRDAQLEAGIANLMERLAKEPRTLPALPKYPKRSKE